MSEQQNESVDFAFVLASSVHDMKNSLGMLLNTLTDVMVQFPAQTKEQEHSYAVLEYEASRINSELIQLLSLYRLEQEQIHVHIDQYSVLDMLEEQVARNTNLFTARKMELQIDCSADLFAYFDVDLLGSVVNNLLVNASRYSKQRVMVSAQLSNNGLLIHVDDDGAGFPVVMLDPVSWQSSKVGFAAGRPHLGLMFASRIAQMHINKGIQGHISLENHGLLGGGRFSIWLP